MNSNKVILSLLLVTVVVSLGFGSSYAQIDDPEDRLTNQIGELNDRLTNLNATQTEIEERIDKFETKKARVQASIDKLEEQDNPPQDKIDNREAKLITINQKIAKLEGFKTTNQEKIDNVTAKIASKEERLAELRSGATQPTSLESIEPVSSYATVAPGPIGASSHVPAQITDFRALFIPHHAGNASPQAGASWIEPNDDTITEYKLEHQLLNGGAEWTTVTLSLGNNTHYIDAEYGSTYSFRILAVNGNGEGPVSDIQSVEVIDFSAPDDTPPVFGPVKNIVYPTSDDIADLPLFTYVKPTATDAVDGPVDVICSPNSPPYIGVNEIFCYATDSDGNRAHTSFTITVPPLAPIDCTIEVVVGSESEFRPSQCDIRYADILLDAIPRSMLYGTATISDDNLAVLITAPDTLPVELEPRELPSDEELDHIGITEDQYRASMPAEPKESFGITISSIYGTDRPLIDITVNYVPQPDDG